MDKRTEEITNRFKQSWIATEKFYDELIHKHRTEHLIPLKKFIVELRELGENSNFRIGTSVYFLIISRSVELGLRLDQKRIRIEPAKNEFFVTLSDGEKIYREYKLNDLNDYRMKNLLKTLKDTLID